MIQTREDQRLACIELQACKRRCDKLDQRFNELVRHGATAEELQELADDTEAAEAERALWADRVA